MGLHYHFDKIEGFEDLCWIPVPAEEAHRVRNGHSSYTEDKDTGEVKRINPVTDALIWLCMSLGMRGITEKNAEEYADRLMVYQEVHGARLRRRAVDEEGNATLEDWFVSRDDVKAHIGLGTNCTQKTRAGWRKDFMDDLIIESRQAEILRSPRKKGDE